MLKVGPGDDGRVCVLRRLEFSSWLITLSYASSGKSLYFPESQPSHFPFVPQFPHLENKDVSPFSWGGVVCDNIPSSYEGPSPHLAWSKL